MHHRSEKLGNVLSAFGERKNSLEASGVTWVPVVHLIGEGTPNKVFEMDEFLICNFPGLAVYEYFCNMLDLGGKVITI